MLRFSFLLALLFVAQISMAQEFPEFQPPPDVPAQGLDIPETEIITVDDVPHTEIYNYLSTAVAHVNTLPDTLTTDGNGTDLVQSESATQLFGYAKWMFSGTSARELLGETLAPIGLNLYGLLTLIIFMAIAWGTIRIALLIYRFVYYLVREILRVLPFVG